MSSNVSHEFSTAQVVNNVNLGLIVVAQELQVVLWNDWMSRHSGIVREQALQQNIVTLFGGQLTPGFLRGLNNALNYGLPSLLSSALHRSPLPLYVEHDGSKAASRMPQSIIMSVLHSAETGAPSCLIQVSDSSTSVKREKMLMSHSDAFKRDAITDALTGIYNRRFFDENYLLAVRHASRHRSKLSLFMIDIDYFKPYNDRYGHIQGDKTLQLVASTLRAQMRHPLDICARYGGEEFILLSPGLAEEQATGLAERLRSSIAELAIPHETSPTATHVTVSVGVQTWIPDQAGEISSLLKGVDEAMYHAKKLGRNQVVVKK